MLFLSGIYLPELFKSYIELHTDQFGFQKNRVMEAILTLRWVKEGGLKKNKNTVLAYVDLENTVDNGTRFSQDGKA